MPDTREPGSTVCLAPESVAQESKWVPGTKLLSAGLEADECVAPEWGGGWGRRGMLANLLG